MLPPVIKSIREGDAIIGGVYGSDISNIFAEIITNSSNGYKLKYVQNIDPSFLNSSGFLIIKIIKCWYFVMKLNAYLHLQVLR